MFFRYPLAWAKDYPGAELPFSIENCMKVVVQLMETQDEVTFDRLLKLDGTNPVLQYNKVFCSLKLDTNAGDPQHQAQVQQTIDGLYGKLDSNYVNGLNIEWQFKIMESVARMRKIESETNRQSNNIYLFTHE